MSDVGKGTAGQVVQATSTGVKYSTATFPSTATSTGTILRADGTNWAATTATYPATTTSSQLLYSSSDNTVAGLSTANSAILATNSSGVPSITTASGNWLNTTRCCFSYYALNNISSVTGDGTIYNVVFNTQIYDQGSNFSSATFTAPVTGKYLICGNVNMYNLGAAHTQAIVTIATTANGYTTSYINSATARELASGNNILGIPFSIIVPMSTNDTATIQLAVTGSTKTVNILGSKGCVVSGCLIC